MSNRWMEIIEDDNRRLSSTRVTMILGAIIGSLVVIGLMVLLYFITSRGINTQTEYTAVANTAALTQILGTLSNVLAMYFMLCAGVYGFAKYSDNSVTKTKISSTAAVDISASTSEEEKK